jgi:hypothetical protein
MMAVERLRGRPTPVSCRPYTSDTVPNDFAAEAARRSI